MKFKVLCLHGYTQTGPKLRDRLGPFRRGLKNQVDLVFVTAPHKATMIFDDQQTSADDQCMAWWNQDENGDKVENEIMQSLDVVKNVLEKEGPFDGVLGFSQGAGMAAIVAALAESGEMRGFRFAMFFAGFYPDQLRLFGDLVKERRLRVPSLHVVGESDAVVPCVRGVDLAARAFENAQVLRHAGGHFVPCNAEWRKIYQAFLATINLE